MFYWLIKEVLSINHSINIFLFIIIFLFTLCASSTNDKTKSIFSPWKLGSIKKSKYWFCLSVDTFGWYLVQLIVLFKQILIFQAVLHYLELIKFQLKHKVSVIENIVFRSPLLATITLQEFSKNYLDTLMVSLF